MTAQGRLLGKSCLIVGGTSGIGLATARRFLEEGARVFVAGLDERSTASARETLAPLGEVRATTADVRTEATVLVLFQAVSEAFGRLDILFHAAGISGRKLGDGPLHDCTLEGWDGVILANATSVFLTNREAVRIMRTQEPDHEGIRGAIVNLGSILSQSPSPHFFATVAYAAGKGATRSLTLASAARYAADRIRFNLIEPGLIDTPMSRRAVNDPTIRQFLATKQPLAGGPGSPDDVAEAALFLCEPATRFLTGVVLPVDAGWSVSDGQIPEENRLV